MLHIIKLIKLHRIALVPVALLCFQNVDKTLLANFVTHFVKSECLELIECEKS